LQQQSSISIAAKAVSIQHYARCTVVPHNTHIQYDVRQRKPFSVGGANKTSFTASRNRSKASHVLLFIVVDFSASVWTVRSTRWQCTTCLLTSSMATMTKHC